MSIIIPPSANDMLRQEAMSEILNYIQKNKGTSYYDIKELAYSQEKKAWISVLENRQWRYVVACCCRDQRKADKVPYKRAINEASLAALTAKIAYRKKHREETNML